MESLSVRKARRNADLTELQEPGGKIDQQLHKQDFPLKMAPKVGIWFEKKMTALLQKKKKKMEQWRYRLDRR